MGVIETVGSSSVCCGAVDEGIVIFESYTWVEILLIGECYTEETSSYILAVEIRLSGGAVGGID